MCLFADEKWSRVELEEPTMGAGGLWELRHHSIGQGSDGRVCITQRLSGSQSGALH